MRPFRRRKPQPDAEPSTPGSTQRARRVLSAQSGGAEGSAPRYCGAEVVGDYVVLNWDTASGRAALGYSLAEANPTAQHLARELQRHRHEAQRRYAVVVVVRTQWGVNCPELEAVDLDPDGSTGPDYAPSWKVLAGQFGTDVPFWHDTLREPGTMLQWRPGVPPAQVSAQHVEVNAEPLTMLAAHEPDGSPAAAVCLWLAQDLWEQDTKAALQYLAYIEEEQPGGCDGLTLAAVPVPVQRRPQELLSEQVRRAGWAQVTERRDVLAYQAAEQCVANDHGRDWLAGAVVALSPSRCATAAEFTDRLKEVATDQPPTVLEHRLLVSQGNHVRGVLLHDPKTGLPAMRVSGVGRAELYTLAPQRLPTAALLAEVVLSHFVVWIRTEDGKLWLAPHLGTNGLNWGYGGSGPYTLALLLEQLMRDITTPALDHLTVEPNPGLLELTCTAPRNEVTAFTRTQLEQALRGV